MSYPTSTSHSTTNLTSEVKMMNTTITQPTTFDINAYRITQNYGETFGSKKIVNMIFVSKPPKGRFFRSSRDPGNTVDVYVFEDKVESSYHLVSPEVAAALGGLVRAITLHLAVDRANNPFLIPVPFPSENGTRNPWHQSLLNAIEAAKERWIRIEADKSAGIYQVHEALGELAEPVWPELSMDELVRIAFNGRVIDNLEHPKVQSALGRI